MFTKDEVNLERFIDVSIIMPPLIGAKWRSYFDDILKESLKGADSFCQPILLSELDKIQSGLPWFDLCNVLEPFLNTPRKLKLFGRHLQVKLKTPAQFLFFYDLVLLSALQASSPRAFEWVSNNRGLLVDPGTTGIDGWLLDHYRDKDKIRGDGLESSTPRSNEVGDAMKDALFGSQEAKLVSTLFIDEHPHRQVPDSFGFQDRSVRRDPFFLAYFAAEKLPTILTRFGHNQLRKAASTPDNPIDQIFSLVRLDWSNAIRQNSWALIVGCLQDFINELDRDASYSCLIVLGILAKEIPDESGFSLKRIVSHSALEFVKRKTLGGIDSKNFIVAILKADISHRMYADLIFYLFTKDESRRVVIDDLLPHLDYIAAFFDERCRAILYQADGTPRDLFDFATTDSPMDLLFRWAQVQAPGDIHHSDYILSFLNSFPKRVPDFIQHVRRGSHDQESVETLMPINYWNDLLSTDSLKNTLGIDEIEFVQSVTNRNYKGLF